jgi:hypothetical protein
MTSGVYQVNTAGFKRRGSAVGEAQLQGLTPRGFLRIAARARPDERPTAGREAAVVDRVDLYWLPLGAGGHCVRFSGGLFEAVDAHRRRRQRAALYHSALEVRSAAQRYVNALAPACTVPAPDRGVVGEGAVGAGALGRLRLFRYEIRRWREGRIPDLAEAVDSPRCVSEDAAVARSVLALVPQVPRLVWGRDERRTGDRWNSNSVIAWLLSQAGVDAGAVRPPPGGRAPGWDAGVQVGRAQRVPTDF